MRSLLLAVTLTFFCAASAAAQAAADTRLADPGPDRHLLYTAGDVEWRDGPGSLEPGAQFAVLEGNPSEPGVFTMRIRMPDGYRIAPHTHPNVERVTVLTGIFHLGQGDTLDPAATTPLAAGAYTSMPPGMQHYAVTEGETVVQLTSVGPWVINYVNAEDDPRGRE